MPALNKLYREYRDRAAFYIVYIQEAHPIDAWQVDDNLKDDVLVASTMTKDERMTAAGACVRNLGIELPALVDEPDNTVDRAYSGGRPSYVVIARAASPTRAPRALRLQPAAVQATLERLLASQMTLRYAAAACQTIWRIRSNGVR